MQDGEKHGWSRFIGSGCLFLMTLLFLCASCQADADLCIYRIGEEWPACSIYQDMIVEHGLTGLLHCSTSWTDTDARVSDLQILIDNKLVEPNQITLKNSNTIGFRWDHLPPSNYTFICRVRSRDGVSEHNEVLTQIKVSIATKPKKPDNFECASYNWENVVCTWEPVPNYVRTRFSLRSEPPGLRKSSSSFDCSVYQEEDILPQNSCVWNATADPSYRLTGKNYKFTLDAENVLGTESFTYEFDHWAHVIPSSPVGLSVPNITSTSASLRWTVPLAMQNFPPGLHYRLSYQNPSQGSANWHTIDITNKTHATEINLDLNNLEPNTIYNVRASMKSALAVGEDKWGQFSEVTFKTPEKPLDLPPRSDIGSFEIVENGDNRDIYIYWKAIRDGDEFPYKVVRVEQNGRTLDVQPDEITETYAKLTGIGLGSARFYIVPANQEGLKNPVATVQVPSHFETSPKPNVFTKVAFDEGIYELSWNPSSNQNITNYTIFWCESGRDRPDQCSGDLDWVHVIGNTNMYNVTVPDPKKFYRFAIAANRPQASSGMTWFSGKSTLSDDVGRVKSVWMNYLDSDEIEVSMDLDYSGRIGSVTGFNIYYCRILSSNNCDGPEMSTTVMTDSHPTHVQGVVRGLRPGTAYMLTTAILSEYGERPRSEPHYFMTQARLDPTTESTTRENTPLKPTTVLPNINVQTVIEESSSDMKDFIKELMEKLEENLRGKLNGMYEINSKITDFETQISNLTLTISALENKFDSLTEENCKLRKNLEKCTAEQSDCESNIVAH